MFLSQHFAPWLAHCSEPSQGYLGLFQLLVKASPWISNLWCHLVSASRPNLIFTQSVWGDWSFWLLISFLVVFSTSLGTSLIPLSSWLGSNSFFWYFCSPGVLIHNVQHSEQLSGAKHSLTYTASFFFLSCVVCGFHCLPFLPSSLWCFC